MRGAVTPFETTPDDAVYVSPVGRRTLRILGIPFLRGRYFAGVCLLAFVVIASVVGPLVVGHSPDAQDLTARLLPPLSGDHLLGTDALGRDLLARILAGGRLSLFVGFTGAALAATLGVLVGLIAGFREGRIGTVVMGIVDAQLAFPFILLAIVFVATLGASLPMVIVVLALSSWVSFARPIHAMALSIKHRDYVLAARSIGARDSTILRRHMLPHVLPTAVVIATIQVAHIVLFESALSFLGMGVPLDIPTWGAMLSDSRRYLQTAPWISIFPGVALVATVFGMSLVGDWMREALDPRREQHG